MNFRDWFKEATGLAPHPWQLALGQRQNCRTQLVRIPTGYGKTLGVVCAWLYHRLIRDDPSWPRRLVYCLPMRVLVEQTEAVLREVLTRSHLLWDGQGEHLAKVGLHVLMGGQSGGKDWSLYPECPAILVGTQDMLLSRGLNRGYAAGRARWPLEFGQLEHDSLWVLDEVQLMDVGLASSAQLQAYLEEDAPLDHGLQGGDVWRPRCSWWMSATLQSNWLRTIDTESHYADWSSDPVRLSARERDEGLGAISKSFELLDIPLPPRPKKKQPLDEGALAELVWKEHCASEAGELGRLTLVVVNTVERACALQRCLAGLAPEQELHLLHSRFRSIERATWQDRFLARRNSCQDSDRILIATQVVEAGVDLSAGLVITELAPWPSLVQRFGRCARFGGTGRVLVLDRSATGSAALPYEEGQLHSARQALGELVKRGADLGIRSLESFEEGLSLEQRATLYPYDPPHLLLRREYEELFDTTPDLSGADLDISRFIRSGDERDLSVFWREITGTEPPPPELQPDGTELCSVPFLLAQEWLCGNTQSLAKGRAAWVWDYLDREWQVLRRKDLRPGQVVLVSSRVGGYDPALGFGLEHRGPVPVLSEAAASKDLPTNAQAVDAVAEESEELSLHEWKTIGTHGREVRDELVRIVSALGLSADLTRILELAGLLHDYGKSHPAFQGSIRDDSRPGRQDLAKAPRRAWLAPRRMYEFAGGEDRRPGFRHELASALALFAVLERHDPQHPALLGDWGELLGELEDAPQILPEPSAALIPTQLEADLLGCSAAEFDLLAYLVASHHGKVRVSLHASPEISAKKH